MIFALKIITGDIIHQKNIETRYVPDKLLGERKEYRIRIEKIEDVLELIEVQKSKIIITEETTIVIYNDYLE